MGGPKYKILIELFNEKTGEVVRIIRLHNPAEFYEFLAGFREMRYPGYGWRYKEKEQKKIKKDE